MQLSTTFWGTQSFLLCLGLVATTAALVARDHAFDTDPESGLKFVPVDSGRFSEHCNNFHFDPKTCVLTADCVKDLNGDHKDRLTSKLNLNKCFWMHKTGKTEGMELGWRVEWNEKNEDRKGITNFCKFCDTTLGPNAENYEYNPLVLWPICLPPDDPKDTRRRRGSFGTYLDRHIWNKGGNMECFGRRGE
ncbi:hypothetical protein B0T20DRAFT_394094 [Sordaria brevicollis]|uniref:CENP-V/GFA domain-containing protein n=1 Tax=Sordaria brevicollis TaxID=83679 RepID=A0AAE0PBM9_SORBR|nr:hypothetical protein B0T20DRAFT_394094 [Sordaria brevicollis]